MILRSQTTFTLIFLVIIISFLGILLSKVFLGSYYYGLLPIFLLDLFLISRIKTTEIKDNKVRFSNIFGVKEFSFNEIINVELFHTFNKAGLASLIFRFNTKKVIIEFPFYKTEKIEEILKILSANGIKIKINSAARIHDELKKYVND